MRWNLSGFDEPEATWVMSGLPSSLAGPRAATAQMAPTTRSTGITSTVPSGTPGNWLSRPRA